MDVLLIVPTSEAANATKLLAAATIESADATARTFTRGLTSIIGDGVATHRVAHYARVRSLTPKVQAAMATLPKDYTVRVYDADKQPAFVADTLAAMGLRFADPPLPALPKLPVLPVAPLKG